MHIREPEQQAKGCVIWMHGLGADAADMMGVADELKTPPLRHVFLDAPIRPVTLNNRMPMRAWYDILGLKFTDREDRAGITQSESIIRSALDLQIKDGFAQDTIFLAGFSQGAAMALFTGLRTPFTLGGIIMLSGYLPLAAEAKSSVNQEIPIFIGAGEYDPLVLPAWTQMSVEHLREHDYHQVEFHRYPMEHSICAEEIRDIGQWITTTLVSKEVK